MTYMQRCHDVYIATLAHLATNLDVPPASNRAPDAFL
jgi:hypothetical protein